MTSFIFLKLQLPLRSWCLSLPSHGGLTCQMQEEGAGRSPSPLPEPVSSALSEDSILPLSALSAPPQDAGGRERVSAPGQTCRAGGAAGARGALGGERRPRPRRAGGAHTRSAPSAALTCLWRPRSHTWALCCVSSTSAQNVSKTKQNKTCRNGRKRRFGPAWPFSYAPALHQRLPPAPAAPALATEGLGRPAAPPPRTSTLRGDRLLCVLAVLSRLRPVSSLQLLIATLAWTP